jgi:hypothetical protein
LPEELDYARFGRQIALPEVGTEGQRALARTPVRFAPSRASGGSDAPLAFAAHLHAKAGGALGDGPDAPVQLALPGYAPSPVSEPCAHFGVGAWAAVEAARRVLGQPPGEIPPALLERLGAGPR